MERNSSGSSKREKPLRINVSPEEFRRIEALEALVESHSKAETIRDGLRLLEFIKQRQEAGWEFLERPREGKARAMRLPEAPASPAAGGADEKISIKVLVKDAAHQRLRALKDKAEVGTMTGLIRNALAVYEHLARRRADGWTVSVKSDRGEERDLELMLLPLPPPQRRSV